MAVFYTIFILFMCLNFRNLLAKSDISKFFDSIIENYFQSCNLILINYLSSPLVFPYKDLYNVEIKLNGTFEFQKFQDIHRQSSGDHCTLVLIQMSAIFPGFSDIFQNILTLPTYGAITKKDEDYFIFYSQENLHNSILLSKFSMKIKYKLSLDSNSAWSLCFYCNKGGSHKVVKIFEISKITSSFLNKDGIFKDFVLNFNGHILRVSAPMRALFHYEIQEIEKGRKWKAKRGQEKTILYFMKEFYNFSYTTFPSKFAPGGTGVVLPNGTWIGCVGDVIYGRADLGFSVAQTFQRFPHVGYATTSWYPSMTFTTGKAKKIYSWLVIFSPFETLLWFLCLGSFILIIITFLAIGNLKYRTNSRHNWKLQNILNFLGGSLLEQSVSLPESTSHRIVGAFWIIFTLIITIAYRSKLVVFLAFPSLQQPPRSFDQLVVSKFKWGMEGAGIGGAAFQNFNSSTNPTYQKIVKNLDFEPDPYNCIYRGIISDFGCIIYKEQAEYMANRNFTNRMGQMPFVIAPDSTFFIASGWVMERRAIYRTNFDKILRRVRDLGLLNVWMKLDFEHLLNERIKWEKSQSQIQLNSIMNKYEIESIHSSPVALNLLNFIGAFIIIFIGFGSSIIVLLSEHVQVNIYKRLWVSMDNFF